jgi:ferrous iron transport protein B
VRGDSVLRDLLVNGIIGGVGAVIVFLPNILILFFFISFMEDTGYMARAAFIMDKLMPKIGLHGKSFIPLIIGFGCNVPAIMATRTLENRKDRILTMLMLPFMSCSAKLPVYVLLISAFFPSNQGLVLVSIYFIGILIAILTAIILRKYLFKEEEVPFVMELPPYRIPTFKNTTSHMWHKGLQYLKKMGGVIFIASILIWALGYFPRDVDFSKDYDTLIRNYKLEIINDLGAIPCGCPNSKDAMHCVFTTGQAQGIAPTNNNRHSEIVSESPNINNSNLGGQNTLSSAQSAIYYARNSSTPAQSSVLETEISGQHLGRHSELVSESPDNYEPTVGAGLKPAPTKDTVKTHNYTSLQQKIHQLEMEKKSEKQEKSYIGQMGKFIEPIISPLGFDWKIGVSIIAGLAAKEIIVSTMSVLYYSGDANGDEISNLQTNLQSQTYKSGQNKDAKIFTPLVAYVLMIFVLLYFPCVATITVIRKEANTKWAIFAALYTTTVAWVAAFLVYQVGRWF